MEKAVKPSIPYIKENADRFLRTGRLFVKCIKGGVTIVCYAGLRLFEMTSRQSRFTRLVVKNKTAEITVADKMVIIIFGSPFKNG